MLFVGTSIIHPSTEGVFLLCNILDLLIYSMYISMTRQAILPLVFAFLLKGFGNLNLIWGAFVLAELCGIPLAAALWKRKGEKQIQF